MTAQPDILTLDNALKAWPRANLAHTPTPLDQLPRLSAHYPGFSFLLKRDDCTGLAMGGNKARQLEFYLGDALSQGCDVVLSTGAVQSNYMRMLAAAAAKLGLECHIQLESRVSNASQEYQESGNVLLDKLFGAHIHHYAQGEDELGADKEIRRIAEELGQSGKKPYVVPLAPVEQPKGALGYVVAARELAQQFVDQDIWPDLLVLASGSGLTHAGTLTGLRAMGVEIPVIGACVRRDAAQQAPRILDTCRKVERMLGLGQLVKESDVQVNDLALFPGYGEVSERVMEAMSEMARLEGILLDPVYSGKTIGCTLMMIESGLLTDYHSILMLHTGGTPALFAYGRQILSSSAFGL